MSKSELHDWEYAIEKLSGNNADKMLDIAQDIYNTAFVRGRNSMTWEREPCEDCVSRAELKKWLDMNFSFGGALRKLELFDRLDKELPSVTPKLKWIQVSERLPKKGEQVLCCNNKSSVFTSALTYVSDGGYAYFGQHFDVIAWQPLPEAYEEEKECEE